MIACVEKEMHGEKNIIADESWIYCYDPATKQQSTEWVEKGGPTPKENLVLKGLLQTHVCLC
ncbi:hypothetical protein J6590_084455 [Homalodisca vitripennis]|nr:hypothetical protein J6590_084455 [Homalodisca vitripennis]